jgi:hypothetical protein
LATCQLRTAFRNCRRRCTRKRRQNRAIASTPFTTRSAARTFWRSPMLSSAPTRVRRAWIIRTSRTSRRTGWRDGWANWRLRSGRRLTDRTQSDAFLACFRDESPAPGGGELDGETARPPAFAVPARRAEYRLWDVLHAHRIPFALRAPPAPRRAAATDHA